MNKQEAINKLKSKKSLENCLSNYGLGYRVALDEAIYIINQIDAQEKPVVPQFVANWYEDNKDNLEWSLYDFCAEFHKRKLPVDFHEWFANIKNKPIETLVKMKLFGYEVKKEKLYTVELPILNGPLGFHYVLHKNKEGEIVIGSFYNKHWRNFDYCQLTESEIKKDHDWAWKYAKEVGND